MDERVETVRQALNDVRDGYAGRTDPLHALAALDSLAAAVADAEQRAEEAEKALRRIARTHYEPHSVNGERIHTNAHVAGCPGCIAGKALAAAVVSAEPTEETT